MDRRTVRVSTLLVLAALIAGLLGLAWLLRDSGEEARRLPALPAGADPRTACGRPTPAALRPAPLLFSDDFEQPGFAEWPQVIQAAPGRIERTRELARRGTFAARFTTNDGDVFPLTASENPRSQLNSPLLSHEGDDQYFSWSTYFPADFPALPPDGWFVFFEWHGPPYAGSPRLAFHVTPDDRIVLQTDGAYGYARLWQTPMARGRWHDFIVHVRWSQRHEQGLVELWHDGVQQPLAGGGCQLRMATLQPEQDAVETIPTNYRMAGSIPGDVALVHDAVRVSTTLGGVVPEDGLQRLREG